MLGILHSLSHCFLIKVSLDKNFYTCLWVQETEIHWLDHTDVGFKTKSYLLTYYCSPSTVLWDGHPLLTLNPSSSSETFYSCFLLWRWESWSADKLRNLSRAKRLGCGQVGLQGCILSFFSQRSVLCAVARMFLSWQWAHYCVLVTAVTVSSSWEGRGHYGQDSHWFQVPGATMDHSWRQSLGAKLLSSWKKRAQETWPWGWETGRWVGRPTHTHTHQEMSWQVRRWMGAGVWYVAIPPLYHVNHFAGLGLVVLNFSCP